MIPSEYMEYFRALDEQNPAAERWAVWWEAHGTEMATLVPRGIYLRLTSPPPETKYMAVFAILEAAGFVYPRPKNYCHPRFYEPSPVPGSWLQEKINRTEFEKAWLRPGILANHLVAIRENLRPDDEIWTFCSPATTWEASMGVSGFAFVREGVPYDNVVTAGS